MSIASIIIILFGAALLTAGIFFSSNLLALFGLIVAVVGCFALAAYDKPYWR